MAFLGETFDVNDLPENESAGDFQPLPDGWYSATITGAELGDTKAGTGKYIRVAYDVTGPTHQGRKVWGNLNVQNTNDKAEAIGRQQLGELMRAAGLAKVKDTDELLGATLEIKVRGKPAEGQHPAGNEVKGWRSAAGSAMPKPQPAAAPAPAGSAPPWAK